MVKVVCGVEECLGWCSGMGQRGCVIYRVGGGGVGMMGGWENGLAGGGQRYCRNLWCVYSCKCMVGS